MAQKSESSQQLVRRIGKEYDQLLLSKERRRAQMNAQIIIDSYLSWVREHTYIPQRTEERLQQCKKEFVRQL